MKTLLDPYTFGNSLVAIHFSDILSKEDIKIRRRISAKIHQYFTLFNHCENIPNKKARQEITALVYDKCKETFKNINAPSKVRSYALNIMRIRYREIIKLKK